MGRGVLVALLMLALAACEGGRADLNQPPPPLGDFDLEHNIVVAPKVKKGPLSRPASKEELTTAVRTAIAERFDRYDGAGRYHFGVSVESYILAQPGIPLVLAPKSGLILLVTVWDDSTGQKMNTEPHQVVVLETFGTGVIVGSGYTLTAEEQLKQLSENAAKSIERFLVKQHKEEGWFAPKTAPEPAREAAATPEA